MSKSRKRVKSTSPNTPHRAATGTSSAPVVLQSWWQAKGPVFRFVAVFALLMGVFYFLYVSEFVPFIQSETGLFPAYLRWTAQVSGWILSVLGNDATVQDRIISTPSFSLEIVRGCDALEATALFVSAVLAFPVAFRTKIPGIVIGSGLLMVTNWIRIVSLYYIGVHWPKSFDMMHLEVWQGAFILLALLLWVTWAHWATLDRGRNAHVSDEYHAD